MLNYEDIKLSSNITFKLSSNLSLIKMFIDIKFKFSINVRQTCQVRVNYIIL